MNSLKQFNTEPFIASLKSFFKELDIPVNYLSDSPAAADDILGDKFKAKNEAHSLIEEVYALGMVDDAIFEGTVSRFTKLPHSSNPKLEAQFQK